MITRGEGSINCSIDDGSAVESVGKTIPILLQAMDIRVCVLNYYFSNKFRGGEETKPTHKWVKRG